ncbi:MAG: fimbrillin family protein [Prevotella sp.]|nr:fimbrillin family protein [Prevotella sp.]
MKLTNYIIISIAMALFTACQSDDVGTNPLHSGGVVGVKASIAPATRLNSNADGATWSAGDSIKLVRSNDNRTGLFVYDGTSWAPDASSYLLWLDGENTYKAFYPATATNPSTTPISFTVPANQTTEDSLNKADFMTASATLNQPTDNKVPLEFTHQMAKVTVKIIKYDENLGGSKPAFSTADIFHPTTITPSTGITISTGGETKVNCLVTRDETEDSLHTYTAIVAPGTYDDGDSLISIVGKFKGATTGWTASLSSPMTIEAGGAYSFDLSVGATTVKVVASTIDAWTENDTASNVNYDSLGLYKFVDLGLPSGTLWADRNVGAASISDYGDYYAWGEIATKDNYSEATYVHATENPYTNAYEYDGGIADFNNINREWVGNEDYDIAARKWHSTWHIPTYTEFRELMDNCTYSWDATNHGMLFTSKINGNSIIFPAGSNYNGTSIKNVGTMGKYWSSTLEASKMAYQLSWTNVNKVNLAATRVFYGCTIRPVYTPLVK